MSFSKKLLISSSLFVSTLLCLSCFGCSNSVTGNSVVEFDCGMDTSISVIKINDIPQVCYRDSNIYFTIENTGKNDIYGLFVTADADYPITVRISEWLPTGDTSEYNMNFGNQKLFNINNLKLKPIIRIRNSNIVCDSASISIDITKC